MPNTLPFGIPPESVLACLLAMVLALGGVRGEGSRAEEGARQEDPPSLSSLDPPVLLPDGSEFRSWEAPCAFARTYYVDQSHAEASDGNPGTAERPFKTIDRAAQVLRPGERVVVAAGVYREWVKPRRGGDGPRAMISYEAAPGARVVIKGSDVLAETWRPAGGDGSGRSTRVWAAPLAARYFQEGYNPFAIDDVTAPQFEYMKGWAWGLRGKAPYALPCGLVFQDGRPLVQVAGPEELPGREGASWLDRPAQVVQVHPFGDVDPNTRTFEVTTRRIGFGPARIGVGFVRVKGFTVEQVGNAFPMQQEGAISTWRGHHWLIEGNTVRHLNGVGIDVGVQHGGLPQPPTVGHHIVRGNTLEDIGICGIAGIGPGGGPEFGLLIEGNVLRRAASHDAQLLLETAGIKAHLNVRCLIRGNLIVDTLHGPGIWMDFGNANSRCTGNVVVNTQSVRNGALFIEASREPNPIDHNVIWGTRTAGLYEHDCAGQVFAHNFVAACRGAAVHLRGKVTDRKVDGQPTVGGGHQVVNNVSSGNGTDGVVEGPTASPSTTAGDLAAGVLARFDPGTLELTWSAVGPVPEASRVEGITHDSFGTPRGGVDGASRAGVPGPFGAVPSEPTRVEVRTKLVRQ